MNILITGGTGFLGSALSRALLADGHQVSVLSRRPRQVPARCGGGVGAIASLDQIRPGDNWQAVVNLAGEPMFAGRWTAARKLRLRASRVGLTQALVARMAAMDTPPAVLISGSAIGYYGEQGGQPLTEDSPPLPGDFPQQLCGDWERAAQQAAALGTRVCLLRTGLVLDGGGGLLGQMLPPFRLGLGGRLGDGQQWMSWIHLDDWLAITRLLLQEATLEGAFNLTAPNPSTNAEFTQALARCLGRPALLPVPSALLKAMLGEMAGLVLASQRVLPERLLRHGYRFRHPELEAALRACLGG